MIFPGALMRAYTFMAEELLASLKAHGTTAEWRDRMKDLEGVNRVVGLEEIMREDAKYSATSPHPILKAGE